MKTSLVLLAALAGVLPLEAETAGDAAALLRLSGSLESIEAGWAGAARQSAASNADRPEQTAGFDAVEGFAASKSATVGGRLLMGASATLEKVRPRVFVAKPEGKIPFLAVADEVTGFILAGVNLRGVCIAAQPVEAKVAARQIDALAATMIRGLAGAASLADASRILESTTADRVLFLVADAKSSEAAAIEKTGDRIHRFGANDAAEKSGSFFPLTDRIRRTGCFVTADPVPTNLPAARISAYRQLSDALQANPILGLDAALQTIERTASGANGAGYRMLGCLLDPIRGTLWVRWPQGAGSAGTANAAYVEFDLHAAVAGRETRRRVIAAEALADAEEIRDRPVRMRNVSPPPRRAEDDIPALFRFDHAAFTVEMEPFQVVAGVLRSKVRFPSPVISEHPENNTVHAEFFRPFGEGPFPSAIVLHIAGGDFELSRFMSQMLAQSGAACLFVKMPYYGERRPKTGRIRMLSDDIERGVAAMRQCVLDLRRACDWFDSEPDCDSQRIAVVGVSLGAIAGSLASAIEPRISRACLIMGGARYEHILFESVEREAQSSKKAWIDSGRTMEDFAAAMTPIDPATYGDRLRQRRVLMICADDDKTIPMASTLALWEATGRQPIFWFPCGHYTMARYLMPALNRTAAFLRDWPVKTEAP